MVVKRQSVLIVSAEHYLAHERQMIAQNDAALAVLANPDSSAYATDLRKLGEAHRLVAGIWELVLRGEGQA